MARSVPEWKGKTDDSKAPNRVRQRCHDRAEGKCHICGLPLGQKKWQLDHQIALANGGENRESNLAPAHITCHSDKTRKDVKTKSKIARVKARHSGIQRSKQKIQGKPLGGGKKPPSALKTALPPLPRRKLYERKES